MVFMNNSKNVKIQKVVLLISTLCHNYCQKKQENQEEYLAIKIKRYLQGTCLLLVCGRNVSALWLEIMFC